MEYPRPLHISGKCENLSYATEALASSSEVRTRAKEGDLGYRMRVESQYIQDMSGP